MIMLNNKQITGNISQLCPLKWSMNQLFISYMATLYSGTLEFDVFANTTLWLCLLEPLYMLQNLQQSDYLVYLKGLNKTSVQILLEFKIYFHNCCLGDDRSRIKNQNSGTLPEFWFRLIRNWNDFSKFQFRSIRTGLFFLKIWFRSLRVGLGQKKNSKNIYTNLLALVYMYSSCQH